MGFFKRLIDFFSLRSEKPIQRLAAYYAVLAVVGVFLFHLFPVVGHMFSGTRLEQVSKTAQLLQDGLTGGAVASPASAVTSNLDLAISTGIIFISTLVLMLPVSWVYMSTRQNRAHNQSIVHTLIIMPIVVAGVVLIVRNSLALAFSLAGIVAAVRFRTSLSDARDVVFIFLAIAVGFAAGVQVLTIATLLSVVFNLILVLMWHYDFGRNVLEPTAASHWIDALGELSGKGIDGKSVPDRDLVLALTPKKGDVLARKFKRVHAILGSNGKKPKFDAIVTITTTGPTQAQAEVELVLDDYTKRWKLDEIVTNDDKASELYYLVRSRKSMTRDGLLTAIRERAHGTIEAADVEIGDAMSVENGEARAARKLREGQ
jgi:hypothetical protein